MSEKKSKNDNLPETGCREAMMVCPECGKEFFCTNQGAWVYKRIRYDRNQTVIFCTWGCMRRYEKKAEEFLAGKKNHFRGKRMAESARRT